MAALYAFSDAHLGSGNPDREQRKKEHIEQLCQMVERDGDRLIILGDLFDFWFEYKNAIPKDHHDVLFMLRRLVRKGIRIDYISGNHDFWMGDFFSRQLGMHVHRDYLDLEYDGRKLHCIHGDGLAPKDRGYRVLKKILRNRFNIWAYRKLPVDWAIPLAKWVSGGSREYTSRRDHSFAKDYRKYAIDKLDAGYDIVMIGHLHIPIELEHDGGMYINTGDFIHHFSYARLENSSVKLHYLTDKNDES